MTLPPDQQQPWIVHKPGGLSGTAHAVHWLIILLTCGLWLIPYLIIVAAAPRQRQEVIAPAGYQWPAPPTPAPAQPVGKGLLEYRWVWVVLYVAGALGIIVIVAVVVDILNHRPG